MRCFLSISLSVLLLVQTLNFGATDVLRFGELIEHARLHSNEYGDSFLDFLNKHYGSSRKDHLASHEGHENLPFRHDQPQTTANLFVLVIFEAPELRTLPISHQSLNYFYTNTYTSLENQKIFQPPRPA